MNTCRVRRMGENRRNVAGGTWDGYKPISDDTDWGSPTSCRSSATAPTCNNWQTKFPGTKWQGSAQNQGSCKGTARQPTCKLTSYNQAYMQDCCVGQYNDNGHCDKGWCPFESACVPYMTPVCATVDENGKLPMDPDFVSDPTRFQNVQHECKTWCAATTKSDGKGLCDLLKHDYCSNRKYWAYGAPETDICKEYCSRPEVNCDSMLKSYCSSLDDPLSHEICACFMPTEFYENFFRDLSLHYDVSSTPPYPHCYYGKCAISNIKPYAAKNNQTPCPNVFQCIQVTEIENNGTIVGPVIIDQSMSCQQEIKDGTITPQKYTCTGNYCVNDSKGTLTYEQCMTSCGDGSVPPNAPTYRYACKDGKTCVSDASGPYTSLSQCLDQCQDGSGGGGSGQLWECKDNQCVQSSTGTYTSEKNCQKSCGSGSWLDTLKEYWYIPTIVLVILFFFLAWLAFRKGGASTESSSSTESSQSTPSIATTMTSTTS